MGQSFNWITSLVLSTYRQKRERINGSDTSSLCHQSCWLKSYKREWFKCTENRWCWSLLISEQHNYTLPVDFQSCTALRWMAPATGIPLHFHSALKCRAILSEKSEHNYPACSICCTRFTVSTPKRAGYTSFWQTLKTWKSMWLKTKRSGC